VSAVIAGTRDDRATEGGAQTILVTGGAGFIGTNLAARLLGDGHRVLV